MSPKKYEFYEKVFKAMQKVIESENIGILVKIQESRLVNCVKLSNVSFVVIKLTSNVLNYYYIQYLVLKFLSKIYVFLSNVPVSATRCPFNPDGQAR